MNPRRFIDYTGILNYIEDEDMIRISRNGLIHVIELIHSKYISRSYEFTLSYVKDLFNIALKQRTTETTLVMIETILRKVLGREEKIIIKRRFIRGFKNFLFCSGARNS